MNGTNSISVGRSFMEFKQVPPLVSTGSHKNKKRRSKKRYRKVSYRNAPFNETRQNNAKSSPTSGKESFRQRKQNQQKARNKQKQSISKFTFPENDSRLTNSARDQTSLLKPGFKKRLNKKRQSRSKVKKADNLINQNCIIVNTAIGPRFIENTQISPNNCPDARISEEYLPKKHITNINENIVCHSIQKKLMDIKFGSYSNQTPSGYNSLGNNSVHSSKSLSRSFQSRESSPTLDNYEDSSYSDTQSDSELFFFDITGNYNQDQSNTSQTKRIYNPSLSLAESQCSNEEKNVTNFSDTTESDYDKNSISFNQFNFDDLRDSSESSEEEEVVWEQLNEISVDRPIESHCVKVWGDSGTVDNDLPIKKEKVQEQHATGENGGKFKNIEDNIPNDHSSNMSNNPFILETDKDPPKYMKCNGQVVAEAVSDQSMSELESDHGHRVTRPSLNSAEHIRDQNRNVDSQIINESFSPSETDGYKTKENIFKTENETGLPEVTYDIQELPDIQNEVTKPEILEKSESNYDSSKMLNGLIQTNVKEVTNNNKVQDVVQTIDLESEKADFWPKILSELQIQKKQREQKSVSPEKVKKMQAIHKNYKIINKPEAASKVIKKEKFNDTGNIQLLREILRTRSINVQKENNKIYGANEHASESQEEINDVLTDIRVQNGNIDFETKVSPASKKKKKKTPTKSRTDSEMIQDTKDMQPIYTDFEVLDKNRTSSSNSKRNNQLENTGNSEAQHGMGSVDCTEIYEKNMGSKDEDIDSVIMVSPAFKETKKKPKKGATYSEMIQDTKYMQDIYAESAILGKNRTRSPKPKKNNHYEDTGNSELQLRIGGAEYTNEHEENVGSQDGNIEFETKVSPAFKKKKKKLNKSTTHSETIQGAEYIQTIYADFEIIDNSRTNSSNSKKSTQLENTGNCENVGSQDESVDSVTEVSPAVKETKKKPKNRTTCSEMIQDTKNMLNSYLESEILHKNRTRSSQPKKNDHYEDTGNSELQLEIGRAEHTNENEENVGSQDGNIEFETKVSPTFKKKKKKLNKSTAHPEIIQGVEYIQTIYADSKILDNNRTNSSNPKKNNQLENTGSSENVGSQDESVDSVTEVAPAFKETKNKPKKRTTCSEMIQDTKNMLNSYPESKILHKNRTRSKPKKNNHYEDTGDSELELEIGGAEYTNENEENVGSQDGNIEFEIKPSPAFKKKKKKLNKSTAHPEIIQGVEYIQTIYADSEILDNNRTNSSNPKKNNQLENTGSSENVGSQDESVDSVPEVSSAFKQTKKKPKNRTNYSEMIEDTKDMQNSYPESEILDKNRTRSSKPKKNNQLEDTGNSEVQFEIGGEKYTKKHEENVGSQDGEIDLETKVSPAFKKKKKKLNKSTTNPEMIQDVEDMQNMYADSVILDINRTSLSKPKKNNYLEDTGNSELLHGIPGEFIEVHNENGLIRTDQSKVINQLTRKNQLESNITETDDINAAMNLQGNELERHSNTAVSRKRNKKSKDIFSIPDISKGLSHVAYTDSGTDVSILSLEDTKLIYSENCNDDIGGFEWAECESQKEHIRETELLENILQKRRNLLEELRKNVDTSEVTNAVQSHKYGNTSKLRTLKKREKHNILQTQLKSQDSQVEINMDCRFQTKEIHTKNHKISEKFKNNVAESVELISHQLSKEMRSMQVNGSQFKWSDLKQMASNTEPKKVRKKKCKKFINMVDSDCEMDVTFNETDNEGLKISDKDDDQAAYSEKNDSVCKEFVDIVDSDCTMKTTLVNTRKKKKKKKSKNSNEGLKIADRDNDQTLYSEEDRICKEFVDIVDSDCTMKTTLTETRKRKRNKKSNEGLKIANRDNDQTSCSEENDSVCKEFLDIVDSDCIMETTLTNTRKRKRNKKRNEDLKTTDRDNDQTFCSEGNDSICKEFVDIVDSDCTTIMSLTNSGKKKGNKKNDEGRRIADKEKNNDQIFDNAENDSIRKEFVDIVDSDCSIKPTFINTRKKKNTNEDFSSEENDSKRKEFVDSVESDCTQKTSLTNSRRKKKNKNSNEGLNIADRANDQTFCSEEIDSICKEFVDIVDSDCSIKTTFINTRKKKNTNEDFSSEENDSKRKEFVDSVESDCTQKTSLTNSRRKKKNKNSNEGLNIADRANDQTFCSEENDSICKESVYIVDSVCTTETTLTSTRKRKRNKDSNKDLKMSEEEENHSIRKEFVDIDDIDSKMKTTLTDTMKKTSNKKCIEDIIHNECTMRRSPRIKRNDKRKVHDEYLEEESAFELKKIKVNFGFKKLLSELSMKRKKQTTSKTGIIPETHKTQNIDTHSEVLDDENVINGTFSFSDSQQLQKKQPSELERESDTNIIEEAADQTSPNEPCFASTKEPNSGARKSYNTKSPLQNIRLGRKTKHKKNEPPSENSDEHAPNLNEKISRHTEANALELELQEKESEIRHVQTDTVVQDGQDIEMKQEKIDFGSKKFFNIKKKSPTASKTEIILETHKTQNIDTHSEVLDDENVINGTFSFSDSQQLQKKQPSELERKSDTNITEETADQTSPNEPCLASTKEPNSGARKSYNTKSPLQNIRLGRKTKHKKNEPPAENSDEHAPNLNEKISRHTEANALELELQEKESEIRHVQTDTVVQDGQDIEMKQEKIDFGSKKFFNIKKESPTTSKTEIILETHKTQNIDTHSEVLDDENVINESFSFSDSQQLQKKQPSELERESDTNIIEETADQTSPNEPCVASTKEPNSGARKSYNTKTPLQNIRIGRKTKHKKNEPPSENSDEHDPNLNERISRHTETNALELELQEKESEIRHVQTDTVVQDGQDIEMKQEKIDFGSKKFFNIKKKSPTTSKTEIILETQETQNTDTHTEILENHNKNKKSTEYFNNGILFSSTPQHLQKKQKQNYGSERASDKYIFNKSANQTNQAVPSSISSDDRNKGLDKETRPSFGWSPDKIKVETPGVKQPYGNRNALIKKICSLGKVVFSKHSNDEKYENYCSTNDCAVSEIAGQNTSNEWIGSLDKKSENSDNDSVTSDTSVLEDKFDPKELSLSVPFPIPPIHQHLAESKQEAEAVKLGITLRKGAFNKEEDKQIVDNWTYFCEYNDLKVRPEDFFDIQKIRAVERLKFLQFLSHGLDTRKLQRVHVRFKTMFKKNHVRSGRYTAEEDAQIIDYIKNTKSNTPFKDLAEMFNRTSSSVQRRYDTIKKAKRTGKVEWNVRSIAKFVAKLMRIKKIKEICDLEEAEVTAKEWKKLSKKMDYIPIERLRRAWKITIYPRLFAQSVDLVQMKKDIITMLYECDINDWKVIDWKSIAEKYPGFTTQNVYMLFRQTMNHHVPKEKHKNVKECLSYLMHNVIEKDKLQPPYAIKRFIAELSEESAASEDDIKNEKNEMES
ncbi:unnamed protein product [Callosobruchus maculatus]|uniref:Uncharacterized protein n=1 Tax=Callosobruchus maculatus TaxID=64391 RepID=A0A653DKY9_CALMS|nr:unnamed protein product [Callosobruchus maculatus]